MIKYSVIIPVYNTYDYVRNIIKWFEIELQNRSNQDIELIIIDDGSTHKPAYEIKHPSIQLYKKENGGVSSARNMGLVKATGEYILFLDSDDAYLAGIFDFLDQQTSTRPDTVVFSYKKRFGEKTKNILNKNMSFSGKDALEQFFLKNFRVHICSLVAKRELLINKTICFDEEIHFSEDVLFITELLANSNKTIVLEKILYLHSIREGSAMNSYMNAKALSHLDAFEKIRNVGYRSVDTKIVNFFVATCYVNLIKFLIQHKTQEKEVFDKIISKQELLKTSMAFPLSRYSLSILVTKFIILLDEIVNFKILQKLSIKRA